MICFVGQSFAPTHLREAARKRGLQITDQLDHAKLCFVSEDTPTVEGYRDLLYIEKLIRETYDNTECPLVVTSQVPPGFMRKLNLPIYHMAETLRVRDAEERAFKPEQFIIGYGFPEQLPIPKVFYEYLMTFETYHFHMVTWEEAEFSKIAINMTLASQVENSNRLSEAAKKVGADWNKIRKILQDDRRIGPYSYLEPGDWKNSQHLLRDYLTLLDIENG